MVAAIGADTVAEIAPDVVGPDRAWPGAPVLGAMAKRS